MTELQLAKQAFAEAAGRIENYKNKSIAELVSGLCEAIDGKDHILENAYISAVIEKFWPRINSLYTKNKCLKLDKGDYLYWVEASILEMCSPDQRPWLKNTSCNPEQTIVQRLNTRYKAQAYYESNLFKHKANYVADSLESTRIGNSEDAKTLMDVIPSDDTSLDDIVEDSVAEKFIQKLIDKRKIVEAIIMDTVAFNDTTRTVTEEKEVVNSDGSVTKKKVPYVEHYNYKLVQTICSFPANYEEYFMKKYKVDHNMFKAAYKVIHDSPNPKKYAVIRKTFSSLQKTVAAKGL